MKNIGTRFLVLSVILFMSGSVTCLHAQSTNHHFELFDYSLDSVHHQIELSTVTSDGGVVLLLYDYRSSITTDAGFSLVKFDVNGNRMWNTFIYGDPTYAITYKRIIQMPDSGFAIVGKRGNVGPGFVIRTDAQGNFLWMKNYLAEVLDISVDDLDGGLFVMINHSNTASHIMKTDANGTVLWDDALNYSTYPDHYLRAHRLSNGNVMTVGVAFGDPSLVYGMGLVACYSPTGTLLWSKGYAGSGDVTEFHDFSEYSNGSIYVTGLSSTSNVELPRPLLMKMDTAGNIAWINTYCSGVPDFVGDFTFADDFLYFGGNFIVLQPYQSTPVVAKLDDNGEFVWCHVYPPQELTGGSYGPYREISAYGNRLAWNAPYTFCNTDTFATASCYLNDTMFSVNMVFPQVSVAAWTAASYSDSSFNEVWLSSSIPDWVKVDFCTQVGVEEQVVTNTVVTVSPNPFGSSFTLEITSDEPVSGYLELLDVNGKVVRTVPVNSKTVTVSRDGLPAGIYFYRMVNQESVPVTGTLIAQ